MSAVAASRWLARLAVLCAAGPATVVHGQALALSHPVMVFVGRVGAGDPGPQRLTIRTTPSAAATWAIPTTLPGWLAVSPSSGTGPGDAVLTVRIAGLAPGYYHVQLTVTSGTESRVVEVFLVILDAGGNIPPPPPNIPIPPAPPVGPPGTPTPPIEIVRGNGTWARYLVEFTFIGYSGLINAYPDCMVNPTGIDHMIGVLAGFESSEQGVDVTYKGSMSRFTEVDYCDVRPISPATPDQVKYCVVTLLGGSTMSVEFVATGDAGRGGWLKARQERGSRHWKNIGGDCDQEVTNQVRIDYPAADHGAGGTPNGQPIQDQTGAPGLPRPPALFQGGHARLRVGTYPAKEPETAWSMRVIARLVP